jgi:hypothetical protein
LPYSPAALAARSKGPEWFLPSAKELKEIYLNQATLLAVPGFTAFGGRFWSSTENSDAIVYIVRRSRGSYDFGYKFEWLNVRAVRAF